MDFDKWLAAVNNCPDALVEGKGRKKALLSQRFGIEDNLLILLRADHTEVINNLNQHSNYTNHEYGEYPACNGFPPLGVDSFDYIHGTGYLQVFNGGQETVLETPEFAEHFRLQGLCNMHLTLHPYQTKKMYDETEELVPWHRVITFMINDVAKIAKEQEWGLCLPAVHSGVDQPLFTGAIYHNLE